MDAYSSSQFSHIDYMFLLLIFPSLMFHDFPPLLSRSIPEYISPCTCTYSLLLICAIYTSYFPGLESLALRPNLPSPLVHLVAPELAKLLITSISLHPTLKDSLLIYLDHLQHSCNKRSRVSICPSYLGAGHHLIRHFPLQYPKGLLCPPGL